MRVVSKITNEFLDRGKAYNADIVLMKKLLIVHLEDGRVKSYGIDSVKSTFCSEDEWREIRLKELLD